MFEVVFSSFVVYSETVFGTVTFVSRIMLESNVSCHVLIVCYKMCIIIDIYYINCIFAKYDENASKYLHSKNT